MDKENFIVSSEIAHLLKERKIEIWSEYKYTDFDGVERLEKEASDILDIFPYAPNILRVVMRLHKDYGIWVCVQMIDGQFCWEIQEKDDTSFSGTKLFLKPEEAMEEGIEFALKSLK